MRDKVKLIKVGGFMSNGVKAGEHFSKERLKNLK